MSSTAPTLGLLLLLLALAPAAPQLGYRRELMRFSFRRLRCLCLFMALHVAAGWVSGAVR